jgi:carboxyl-terminal processing protease
LLADCNGALNVFKKLRNVEMFYSRLLRALSGIAVAASATAFVPTIHAQSTVTVVEYINVRANAFFLTGRANEQAVLDTVPDFKRTGMTFTARPATEAAGSFQPICRYRIAVTPTFSSHFYGLPADCQLIAGLIANGTLKNFFDEGLDFAVEAPVSGNCSASSPVAVRRALRTGTPVEAPNHRYTVSMADYQDQLVQGWNGENVVFCGSNATAAAPRASFFGDSVKKNFCEVPRTGISPRTGQAYPDLVGTRADEKDWIRYWTNESYLWYREIPNPTSTAAETVTSYFSKLKSPAVAASGGNKDRFSFAQSTEAVDNTNAGVIFGYGIEWAAIRSSAPRQWVAAVVDPGSPAANAGVQRGDRILQIDGADFVNGNDVNTLNRGLFPPVVGEAHSFVLQSAAGASKSVVLNSASLPLISVPVSGVINTATGRVGYIAFTTFNSFTAEKAIADAVAGLTGQGINDLVLDLRYNGGGYIYISSQLAYMIAGAAKTNGRVFERTLTNDKKPFGTDTVYPFYNVGSGFTGGVASGQALPTLNLNRVFVLTTADSCSASESFINSLRGLDIPVIQIGGTTCGKPYGFSGRDNCGTTYYPIQFTGVNQKGEGDFINGFAPTCVVPDDLTKSLGDPAEGQLAAALVYRSSNACPASNFAATKQAVAPSAGGASVADVERGLRQMKLATPTDTLRNSGTAISPRQPQELGRFELPQQLK